MSEKINPCPNPKCRGTSIVLRPTLGTTSYNTYVSGDSYAGIRPVCDDCQLAGPWCRDKPEAIAAWNSISMGWINAKDREPPKDGTMILATMRTASDRKQPMCVRWIENGYGDRWFCPESGEEYLDSELTAWMPIPPTPEGE